MARMAEVLVVGAGIGGLAAARDLSDAGHDVVVVDESEVPGGRMAAWHLGHATWDTGAQFVTAKTDDFRAQLERWRQDGVATTWFHGSPDASRSPGPSRSPGASDDGHPRFRGVPAMPAIPARLAADLAVRTGVRIDELRHADGRWVALADDGAHLSADAVVLTPPAPRSLALLGSTAVGRDVTDALRGIDHAPCWAVLVRPDGTPDLPDHGALRLPDHALHMVVDNRHKGVSAAPAVTLHASPERSRQLLDHPGDVVGARLLDDASPWLAGEVVHTHRWRWSMPTGGDHDAAAVATSVPGPLAVASDGLAGGRVEGAWTSGRAAARQLFELL